MKTDSQPPKCAHFYSENRSFSQKKREDFLIITETNISHDKTGLKMVKLIIHEYRD